MNKISITLDVSKFDKSHIVEKKFKTKDGTEVTKKEYQIEVIELKAPKFVAEGKNYKMYKTHFVVQAQTKEEREKKVESVFVGDAFSFERPEIKQEKSSFDHDAIEYGDEDINVNDIPF